MLERIKKTIEKHSMFGIGDKIVIGVSGGADSVTLLHTLDRLKDEYQLSLFIVHLNHMFRGKDADEDGEFVAKLGDTLGVPAFIKKIDIPKMAQEKGLSSQVAAREARYQLYEEVACQVSANRIALGHNADDQVETVLMRLLRGAGEEGLSGIPPVREQIIRPLIEISRADIESYCREQQLEFRTDYSNFKTIYLRNKIRIELLPKLEKEYNNNIKQIFLRLSDISREDNSYLHSKALEHLESIIVSQEFQKIILAWEKLAVLPKALQRRVLREGIRVIKGNLLSIGFIHLEEVISFFFSEQRGKKILPGGIVIEKSYKNLVIRKEELNLEFAYKLQIPGLTEIPEAGVKIKSELIEKSFLGKPKQEGSWQVYLDYNPAQGDLVVRNRKDGDRFRPVGLGGSKKLKDFFIDEKIPRSQRDQIPILVQGEEILWVVGKRLGERQKEQDLGKYILLLQAELLEERGINYD